MVNTAWTIVLIFHGHVADIVGKGSHHGGHHVRGNNVVGWGGPYQGGGGGDCHGEYWHKAEMALFGSAIDFSIYLRNLYVDKIAISMFSTHAPVPPSYSYALVSSLVL